MSAVSVKFSETSYLSFLDGEIKLTDFLKTLLLDGIDSGPYKRISDELFEYHRHNGGSQLKGLGIVDGDIDRATQKGKIRFKYEVEHHYACADMTVTHDLKEYYNFSIDNATLTLSIVFPPNIIRDTVDEF